MSIYSRAGRKLAEEMQLLAEERWIIEAIKKIRTQRNCLQIERLQLESMLASQSLGPNKKGHSTDTDKIVADNLSEMNPTMLLQNIQSSTDNTVTPRIEDEICNIEALDLTVTNPTPSFNLNNVVFNEDEDEEDNEEHENDIEEVDIDMNMFMNSNMI